MWGLGRKRGCRYIVDVLYFSPGSDGEGGGGSGREVEEGSNVRIYPDPCAKRYVHIPRYICDYTIASIKLGCFAIVYAKSICKLVCVCTYVCVRTARRMNTFQYHWGNKQVDAEKIYKRSVCAFTFFRGKSINFLKNCIN